MSGDSSLRRMKGDHLKKRADQAMQEGNYRAAWETYAEAIQIHPDKAVLKVLHSNRSLAYAKAQRFQEALQDADEAARLAPGWGKAQWRRGAALLGLRNVPAAVDAFHKAWELQAGDKECEKKLWQVVQRLTREQLGRCILEIIAGREAAGELHRAEVEATDAVAMQEAAFRVISNAHKGQSPPGPYYASYLRWLTLGLPPGEAYYVRSAVHRSAKCYLQAASDAQAAVEALAEKLRRFDGALPAEENGSVAAGMFGRREEVAAGLAAAYLRLGEAHLAEPKHADRDPFAAFKALTKATELESSSQELHDRLQEATEELTKEQVEQAAAEAASEGAVPAAASATSERTFMVRVVLEFQNISPSRLHSELRESLRQALAAAAQVSAGASTLEAVRPARPPERPNLEFHFHVSVGPHFLQGNALAKAVSDPQQLAKMLQGCDFSAAVIGHAELTDVTPKHASAADTIVDAVCSNDKQLAVPPRPKLELELPFKMYRLVNAHGAVERADKHPFAMSRVYYDAAEKPEEVWVELADASCRWRQTGGEVRILALKVPADLPPRRLGVDIAPYSLKVYHRQSGEVFLEGQLHHGVVPEDCFWTHCGGKGEDGCCITLRKMNLEVLQRHWAHAESWWPRLFQQHAEIAWDDYEKDYSDLPQEVLQRHRIAEGVRDEERRMESGERRRREALQEADDLRKRRRQERLHQLRAGGGAKDWVQLHREL